MTTAIAFGTFDLVHQGHEFYLQNAKQLASYLIVVIALDQTVLKTKGRLPLYKQEDRLQAVKKLNIANEVILGSPSNPYQVLLDYKPNIIALGYDQEAFTKHLDKFIIENDLPSKVVRIDSFQPHKYKSSLLKKNL